MVPKIELEKPLIVLLLLAVVYTFFCMNLVSKFEQGLPSPLFGGDYYYQLGAITHMYGVPITEWADSTNGIGNHPAYFIFYGALVTIFGKLLSFAPMQAMFSFNIIVPAASLIAFYFLFKKLFSDGWVSLLATISAVSLMAFPIFKYTEFTKYVILPLFLYSLYLFFTEQNRNKSIFLGLMYGIMAISHSTAFVFSSLAIAAVFLFLLYSDKKSFSISLQYLQLKKWFIVAFLIGFIIAQIYWFEPIFVYRGQTPLGSQLWSTEDFSSSTVQFTFLSNTLFDLFLNNGSIFALVSGILTLAGLFFFYKKYKELKSNEIFIFLIFFVSFVLTFSYFITMPLLGTNFVPGYVFDLYLRVAAVGVAMFGLLNIIALAGSSGKYVIPIMFCLFIISTYANYDAWYKGRFEYYRAIDPQYLSLQEFLIKDGVHGSVLSSNELSFAVNALSGKDLVASRRAHNDPFVNFDKYQLDAAIMLYGNNLETKKQLFKKYDVKYLYVDGGWPSTEWMIQNGNIVSYSDPLLMFYSLEKEQILSENEIKYLKIKGWVDPSVRGINAKTYDLIIISPENYNWTGKGPWKDDIDPFLNDAWDYEVNGQLSAALFKVSIN